VSEKTPKFSDQEARELWRRAVELQADAESTAPRSRALQSGAEAGFSLEQVLEAAESAGIGADFVQMAIAERRLPEADQLCPGRRTARWHHTLLRDDHAIEVSRLIDAPPERTLAAFRDVVAKPAFHLVPEDRVGPDPPLQGVLVYRIDGSQSISSSFHGAMTVADARVVLVTARVDERGTLLLLRVPKFDHAINLTLTSGLVGGLGVGGGYGGTAVGSALAAAMGTASIALVAAPVALGALVGAGLGLGGCRGVYRWGRRKGEEALRRLLQTVALERTVRAAHKRPGRHPARLQCLSIGCVTPQTTG